MLQDFYKTAYEILGEYIRRVEETDDLDNHNTFRGVGFYIDSSHVDKDARTVIEHPYFVIKAAGMDLTFGSGRMNKIEFKDADLSPLQDIQRLLDDTLKVITGDMPLPSINRYAITSQVITREVRVETVNEADKAKAQMLDQILSRSLSIGEDRRSNY